MRDAARPRLRSIVTTILVIMIVDHDRQGHIRAPLGAAPPSAPDVTERSP